MSSESTVLGVDLSTQSCTVEVRKVEDFAQLATASVRLSRAVPPVSEQQPEEWWTALQTAMELLREQGICTGNIEAVSVAAQCHGLVALDKKDKVIRPAKLWNDTTGSRAMNTLVARFGNEFWVERTQSVPKAAFTIAKLAHFVEEEPETIEKTASILLPHDYLTFRLTGEKVTDRSDASGTGYFDSVTNTYRTDLLEACFGSDIPWVDLLPKVLAPDTIAGWVTKEAARDLGLRMGIPVGTGGGDQHIAAAGLGMLPGDVCFSLGTSGVVFTVSDSPIFDTTGMVDGVASATGGWMPVVCTLNCTQVTDKFAELMGVDVAALGEEALAADPAGPRPAVAAYLGGERSPDLPNAQGLIAGIANTTTRSQLALAAFEGVLFGLLRGLECIAAQQIPLNGRVIAIGGGARSLAYRQLLADHLNRPVIEVDSLEATARGASLQALAVFLGETLASMGERFPPMPVSTTDPRTHVDRTARSRYAVTATHAAAFDWIRGL